MFIPSPLSKPKLKYICFVKNGKYVNMTIFSLYIHTQTFPYVNMQVHFTGSYKKKVKRCKK